MNKIEFYKETNFKETPIGILPKDWDVVKLEDNKTASLVKSGSTPSKNRSDYWNGAIPFVTIGDMTKTEKYLYDTESKITDFAIKNSNTILVPENCILLSMYGTIGKVVINKVPATISQNIAAIVPNRENVYEEFLYYALKHYSFQFKGAKIITLKHLDMRIVKDTKIPLPPIEEQRAVAEVLSVVDLAVQRTDMVIVKTERLKKGLMQTLLTRGIGHKELKNTEIGKIPKTWQTVKLGEIGNFQYGITTSAIKEDTGIKLLRITDITDEGINWKEVPYCKISEAEFDKYKLNLGDVLFARIGATTGKSCYINQPVKAVFGSYLIKFIPIDKEVDTSFLYIFTQSETYWNQVNRRKEGQLKKGLNTKMLGSLLIPLPPPEEQHKISRIFSAVDIKLEFERKEKARLELIKRGLMDLLLTGKIRVRVKV
ncbi:MAG: restriction endonuclease subunit S [Candidatus Bathyarchaeia archaeon]